MSFPFFFAVLKSKQAELQYEDSPQTLHEKKLMHWVIFFFSITNFEVKKEVWQQKIEKLNYIS